MFRGHPNHCSSQPLHSTQVLTCLCCLSSKLASHTPCPYCCALFHTSLCISLPAPTYTVVPALSPVGQRLDSHSCGIRSKGPVPAHSNQPSHPLANLFFLPNPLDHTGLLSVSYKVNVILEFGPLYPNSTCFLNLNMNAVFPIILFPDTQL